MRSTIQFGTALSAALAFMACTATPVKPALAQDATAIEAVKERVTLEGNFAQGGLVFGEVLEKGTRIRLDSKNVPVDSEGNFLFGFGRDHGDSALLTIEYPDGTADTRALSIAEREFKEERINNLPSSQVNEFTQEQLSKIRKSTGKKKAARENYIDEAIWTSGFIWPTHGRISGKFGSQRILNGVPKRPHSGMDIANSVGTPVRAPASGTITLADRDMYFEGQLVFINHGQGLESALMHLSRIDVVAGQPVEKGDIIGAIGATGRATGPHLHWSLKWGTTLVDPQYLLDPEFKLLSVEKPEDFEE